MGASQAAAGITWLAVIVAALASFPLGMLWYGPLFGKAWMAASGVTKETGRGVNPLKLYGTSGWQFGLFAGLILGAWR